MKLINYIFKSMSNKEARNQIINHNNLLLKNNFINQEFISKWNLHNDHELMGYGHIIEYLFKVTNEYLETTNKLIMWYEEFQDFKIFSIIDLKNNNIIYEKQIKLDYINWIKKK